MKKLVLFVIGSLMIMSCESPYNGVSMDNEYTPPALTENQKAVEILSGKFIGDITAVRDKNLKTDVYNNVKDVELVFNGLIPNIDYQFFPKLSNPSIGIITDDYLYINYSVDVDGDWDEEFATFKYDIANNEIKISAVGFNQTNNYPDTKVWTFKGSKQ